MCFNLFFIVTKIKAVVSGFGVYTNLGVLMQINIELF